MCSGCRSAGWGVANAYIHGNEPTGRRFVLPAASVKTRVSRSTSADPLVILESNGFVQGTGRECLGNTWDVLIRRVSPGMSWPATAGVKSPSMHVCRDAWAKPLRRLIAIKAAQHQGVKRARA